MKIKTQSIIRCHPFLTFFGGLSIVLLLCVCLTVPLMIFSKPFAGQTGTTTTAITAISTITIISGTIIASPNITATPNTTSTTVSSTTLTTSSTNPTDTTTTTSLMTSTASSTTTTGTTSTTSSTTTTDTTTTTSLTTSTTSSTTTTDTTTTTSTTMSPLRWNTTSITVAGQMNQTNATPNYLNTPVGIVLDSSDFLYVTDQSNHRVQKFSSVNTTGMTVCGNSSGSLGSTPARLTNPYDVGMDSNGNIYVVDTGNNRVQLWRVNASSGITVAGNGTAGNSTNQLDSPRCITFDAQPDTFYISEVNNNRVMRFVLNSTVGTLVAGGNGPGINNNQLFNPRGLYFDSSTNSLLIANQGAHNVVRWVIGASSWALVAGKLNGVSSSGATGLYNPWDVILDRYGNIYIADRSNNRLQFFLFDGANGTTIGGVSNSPISIALDSQLNLYASESSNNRIQKYIRY